MYIRKSKRYNDPDQYDNLKSSTNSEELREVMNDNSNVNKTFRKNTILKEHLRNGTRYDA